MRIFRHTYRLVTLLCIALMALCASAQRVDSVANSAPTAKSSIPPEIVTKLQRLNADTVMPVEGVSKLVNEIFSWSRRKNRPDVNARLLSRYGIYLSSLGFFDLSTDIFRCASQFISPTDEKVYVFAQAGRAVADFHNGLRSEAEATLLDIEKQVDAMPQSAPQQIMLLTIYNYLGDIYKDTGREPKAYENYEKSLKISMALGDSHTACVTISSMCALNFYNDRVESLLNSAMAMAIQLEDNKVLYNLLMAKAQLAYKEADYQRALVELEKAESYSQIIRNDNGNPVVLKQMCEHLLLRSRCYANLNQPARAYETMTNYLDEHDRRARSTEELHNAHWSICHDLIAQCDAYHGDLLQAEQNNNWYRNRRSLIIIIFILSLTLAVMIVVWVVRVRKQSVLAAAAAANGGTEALLAAQYGEQLAAADHRISHLEQRERELTQTATVYSLYLNARNELLEKLRDLVRQGYKLPAADQAAHQKKISAIIALSLEKDSKVDKQLIDVIYEENAPFFEHLKARCATLTDNELRMALYVHVGISTRNIAQMTGQPVKTVSMTRFRLRKALGYDSDEEMNTALAQM